MYNSEFNDEKLRVVIVLGCYKWDIFNKVLVVIAGGGCGEGKKGVEEEQDVAPWEISFV